ncbi:putative disease resistance RPP13-like protein 1 [Senna tora]|uniref:Putative disease resistance RPP13-like protein 1 n=1 Tax=Senna tora TaxID=362788 RepID=A0A834X225_9FABA|nr:putative disease resistance RPP13-like protein 1 [Senna tora]
MAAELVGGAFLSAAFQVAFQRLASSDIRGYFRGRKSIDGLLKKLHITLISVNQVLDDAEERQYSNSNVKKWVDELKHVVFLADDLLDEIAYEATRQKLEAESQTATSKVRGFFTSSVNQFDKQVEGRIKEVLADLQFLAKQKDVLGLMEGCGGGSTEVGRCENIIELVNDIVTLKHLRYLDLSGTPIGRLPDSICVLHNLETLILNGCYHLVELPLDVYKLINLRNLELSETRINKLPNSICELVNLHTLCLRDCTSLAELPANFHQLINLHHLDLVGTNIREMPQHIRRLTHLQHLPVFFVGKQNGLNIKELGEVSNLEGTFSISQLENINDAMDAREANLREKKCLHKLELEWSESHVDSQNERCVLEALQPHANLKELTIMNYGGTRFVGWFDALCLPNLVSLEMVNCNYCFCLPPLGQLPSLKNLSIFKFEGIKEIGTEFYGNKSLGVAFRCLESLEFWYMGEWEEWMHSNDECFPCLQHLSLISCPKLTNSLPPHLASLKSLHISECQKLEPSLPKAVAMTNADIPKSGVQECWLEQILVTCPDLEKLCLSNCPKLVSFPTCELSAPKLESFSISNMSYQRLPSENMQTQLLPTVCSLWFKNCPFLRSLELHNCPLLESFHMNTGLPSSLVKLSIKRCPKLVHSCKEWRLHNLLSLQEFRISDDFESVESFPDEALLPPNLCYLEFDVCPNLKTINYEGLLHLTSLRSLYINCCPNLQCLPEQGLPNSLSSLHIYDEGILNTRISFSLGFIPEIAGLSFAVTGIGKVNKVKEEIPFYKEAGCVAYVSNVKD